MRIALQNFKWGAVEFLKRPTLATATRIKMLRDDIAKIKKLYDQVTVAEKFNRGAQVVAGVSKSIDTKIPAQTREHQK